MQTDLVSPATFEDQQHGFPAAITALKRSAWARFNQLPLPKKHDEQWRFARTKNARVNGFFLAEPRSKCGGAILAAGADPSREITEFSAKFIFTNNRLESAIPPAGASFGTGDNAPVLFAGTLADAFKNFKRDFLAPLLFDDDAAPLGGNKFLLLHNAYLQPNGGAVIVAPDNYAADAPVVIVHRVIGGAAAVFPHTLILAGKNARLNIVEFYISDSPPPFGKLKRGTRAAANRAATRAEKLAISATEIRADEGAKISRVVAQCWGNNVHSYQLDRAHLAAGAAVTGITLNLGAKHSRFESALNLHGAGADARLYGLSVADGTQEFDQRTLQVHDAAGATSDLLFKNALLGSAHTIFSGLIRVAPGAQRTDAYQTNRNLLLSPKARADALPGLLIEANDVKCSHGATNSELDRDELFYLNARGIPTPVARELLVAGFFEEILEKVPSENTASALRRLIQEKLAGAEQQKRAESQ